MLEPAPCQEGIDLGILIDHSNSIRYRHIKRLYKQFMPAFLKNMKMSKKKTRVAVIKYNKEAILLNKFKGKMSWSYKTAASFFSNYKPKLSTLTRTDLGLKAAHNNLFIKKSGERRNRQNVLLTFTDGRTYPRRFIRSVLREIPILRVSYLKADSFKSISKREYDRTLKEIRILVTHKTQATNRPKSRPQTILGNSFQATPRISNLFGLMKKPFQVFLLIFNRSRNTQKGPKRRNYLIILLICSLRLSGLYPLSYCFL